MNTIVQDITGRRTLADGTSVDSLIDREAREISQRVFHDAEIYQLELEKLWRRAWIIVGHESEIPNPGDFVNRKVGDDNVIISRQRNGEIAGLLNVCPHRGTTVCRSEVGNTPAFRCIYHGWVFNTDGSFRGAPFANLMYSDGMPKEKMGLRRARIAQRAGIIFLCWSDDAPSLEEFLGDYAWYFDMIYDRCEGGLEVLGPPQRFVIDGNWKTAAEQFGGDAWHACNLHKSLGVFMPLDQDWTLNDPEPWNLMAPKIGTKEGHNIICFEFPDLPDALTGGKKVTPLEKLMIMPPPGMTREDVARLPDRFTPEQIHLLATNPPSNGGMFPNVAVWSMNSFLLDGLPAGYLSFRTFVPLGVDKFEFCMWAFVAKGAPDELRERMRMQMSFAQGAAGFVEQDDATVWPGMTQNAKGSLGRENKLKYWASAENKAPDGWPGGGEYYSGFAKDDTQWNWWSRYFDYLLDAVK